MRGISKRFLKRARPALRRYQRILKDSRDRDINESDTVTIIGDFLSDVLGFDKYKEISSEHAVRGTFCDLAVTVGSRVRFLIEAKAIGKDLRDNHLRQVVDYGANEGIEWVILTNGAIWQAHRIRFEKPIGHDEVFSVNLLEEDGKDALERLFVISREACGTDAIDLFYRRKAASSRFVLGNLLLTDRVVAIVRREIRRLVKGVTIGNAEIAERLRNEVIKRDVLEGEHAADAMAMLKRGGRRRARKSAPIPAPAATATKPAVIIQSKPAGSVAEVSGRP